MEMPPNNFRSIPVLPTAGDIFNPCTFLRPNIVKGKYHDTEHYLDIQYRLLREDCLKAMREGILEYLEQRKQGKSIKNIKDVKIHFDVHVVDQDFVNGRLVHIAFFNDASFQRIRWKTSKRLLPGSLLCMSSDGFKTLSFVTVAYRDFSKLTKGLLPLYFEELTEEVANIKPSLSYVVFESNAYFEAYRHNLGALRVLNEEMLPLKRYIIETKQSVYKPQYLDENAVYDMRPLLLPLDSFLINDVSSGLSTNLRNLSLLQRKFTAADKIERLCRERKIPRSICSKSQRVKVLDDRFWPSALELNMDETQYAALKAAVTKEFAVVQGPPGTGKTFVGLRITQLLLHNMKSWKSVKSQVPIMVVCQTNHALDQFLEGILQFTKKVVRIGGSSSNKAISKHQLNNVKEGQRRRRSNRRFSSAKSEYFDLMNLGRSIMKIQNSIKDAYNSIVRENELRLVMSSTHYKGLTFNRLYKSMKSCLMRDWLEINQTSLQEEDEVSESDNGSLTESDIGEGLNYTDDEWESNEEDTEEEFEYISDLSPVSLKKFVYEMLKPHCEFSTQIKEEKKQLASHIRIKLTNCSAMSEIETSNIQSVWEITLEQRWRLYKFWIEKYIQAKEKESMELQRRSRSGYVRLCELRTVEDGQACQNAHVIGMTTTGAAKYRELVQSLNPVVLIVEEAAELLESHVVTSLASKTQHVILIGDHQQLRPNPSVHLLAVKYGMNISLFERMVENGLECYSLGIQHRMRKEISALLVPHIYRNLKDHESVFGYENIKGVGKNVFFVNHSNQETHRYDSKSKFNEHEAAFLLSLCRYLLLQGYKSSQITVLTTYSAQLSELKRQRGEELKHLSLKVVDNYQGEENDIILISFVRSNKRKEIGFLKTSNRVCVALSRAKKGLFGIGDFNMFADTSELWKNIVDKLKQQAAIGPSLELVCQNHPDVSTLVSTEKDFDAVPEGGCRLKCEYLLPCGHVCTLMCHPYDAKHEQFKCLQSCCKKCIRGLHECPKKCFEKCGPCIVQTKVKRKECQHYVLCHQLSKIPKRGDKFILHEKCKVMVEVKSKMCLHKVVIECCYREDAIRIAYRCGDCARGI